MRRPPYQCPHPDPEPRCRRCHHLAVLHLVGGACVMCTIARKGIFACRRSPRTARASSYPSLS